MLGNKTLTLVTPSQARLTQLADTMAIEDRQELWGHDHSTPLEGLLTGVSCSKDAWMLVTDQGVPICAFGIQEVSLVPQTACFWLLGSTDVPLYSRSFLRWSRLWMTAQSSQYDRLINYVGDWHVRSQRWLLWLGFTLSDPFPFGVEQWPWRTVTKKGQDAWA